ncbi:hypothetical protein NMG60_11007002 [Bertholletia excelsa]
MLPVHVLHSFCLSGAGGGDTFEDLTTRLEFLERWVTKKLQWTKNEEMRFLDLDDLDVRQGNITFSMFNKTIWSKIEQQMIMEDK